jgi:hypothetical protein
MIDSSLGRFAKVETLTSYTVVTRGLRTQFGANQEAAEAYCEGWNDHLGMLRDLDISMMAMRRIRTVPGLDLGGSLDSYAKFAEGFIRDILFPDGDDA